MTKSNRTMKLKTACEVFGHQVLDRYADVNKTIQMPKSAEKEIPDLMLTRYACYLIAQNGDPRKPAIAFAKTNNQAVRNTLLERGIRTNAFHSLPSTSGRGGGVRARLLRRKQTIAGNLAEILEA